MGLVTEPINLSADLTSADWTKTSLDLIDPGGGLVKDLAGLQRSLQADGVTVEHFKTLPAYELALASGNYPWLADL